MRKRRRHFRITLNGNARPLQGLCASAKIDGAATGPSGLLTKLAIAQGQQLLDPSIGGGKYLWAWEAQPHPRQIAVAYWRQGCLWA